MLDVACGHGRHMAWFKQHGLLTTGIDRSATALASASPFGRVIQADIEAAPWPLQTETGVERFDLVVVSNYLWRPLLPTIVDSVDDKGLLIYETFMQGNQAFGKPSNPDFLLQPGELIQLCQSMDIVAFEQGFLPEPQRCVQRIVARVRTPQQPEAAMPLESLK